MTIKKQIRLACHVSERIWGEKGRRHENNL